MWGKTRHRLAGRPFQIHSSKLILLFLQERKKTMLQNSNKMYVYFIDPYSTLYLTDSPE